MIKRLFTRVSALFVPPKPRAARVHHTDGSVTECRIVRGAGTCLKTFEMWQYHQMLEYCDETKAAMTKHNVRGEVVYTRVVSLWGKNHSNKDTWQVYVI